MSKVNLTHTPLSQLSFTNPPSNLESQTHILTPTDIPTILTLILDLAAYEKEPASTVEATPEKLLKTIAFAPSAENPSSTPTEITPQRPARCLLLFPSKEDAKAGGKAAGLALYYYTYSTWRALPGIHLEDLYVEPEWRGKGFGSALLAELAKEVLEMGGARCMFFLFPFTYSAFSLLIH